VPRITGRFDFRLCACIDRAGVIGCKNFKCLLDQLYDLIFQCRVSAKWRNVT
jgi:hypothetical protein